MLRQIQHITTKTPLIFRVVPLYLLVVAAVSLPTLDSAMPRTVQSHNKTETVTTREVESLSPIAKQGRPVWMSIPRLGLEHDIVDGSYDSKIGDWSVTDDKVQYATMTSLASDQPGQTLLYGHNTVSVLESVRWLQPGDELIIKTDNGHEFRYSYSSDRVVVPTDVSVLREQPDSPRLVLMTCEGIFSDTRRLLYFDFQEAA